MQINGSPLTSTEKRSHINIWHRPLTDSNGPCRNGLMGDKLYSLGAEGMVNKYQEFSEILFFISVWLFQYVGIIVDRYE